MASRAGVSAGGVTTETGWSGTLSKHGKRIEPHKHCATATTMYREMGMTYWLEKAEAEMAGLG